MEKHLIDDALKYEWNNAGMLTRVIRPDKAEVTFKYDALGQKVVIKSKDTIIKSIWDENVSFHNWKEEALKDKS